MVSEITRNDDNAMQLMMLRMQSKMQPPFEIVPSLFGQEKPASIVTLYTLAPNFFFKYALY